MSFKPPFPGEQVYIFDQRARSPVQMRYVRRNRSWHYFEREGREVKFNGCPEWHTHASQSTWAAFASHVVSAGLLIKAGSGRGWAVDRAYSLACEYVRRFADELKKPAGEVWESGRDKTPARELVELAEAVLGAFSANGEFNTHTAEHSPLEIRAMAQAAVRKYGGAA